jgi:hypothetical protein
MTTLREKRHRQCLNTIARLTEQRELAFRRLAIIQHKLADERRRLARLQKELGKQPAPKFTPLPKAPAWVPKEPVFDKAGELLVHDSGPDLSIPDFLKRDAKDAAARAEIAAEKEARAKAKRDAKGVVTSKRLGPDASKMPLTGKAALKAIRGR